MPLYDYVCAACGHRFEVIHGVDGHGPESCPNCGEGPVTKGITTAAVHYKGSGWAKKERHAAKVKSAPKADGEGAAEKAGTGGTETEKAAKANDSADATGKGTAEKAGEDKAAAPSPATTGD